MPKVSVELRVLHLHGRTDSLAFPAVTELAPEDVDISAVIRSVPLIHCKSFATADPELDRSFGFEALLEGPLALDYPMNQDPQWSMEQPDNLYGFFSL